MNDLCLVMLPNPQLTNPKMYYSLGILYLSAVTKRAGFTTIIADLRDGLKDLPEARYYGFSATTPEIAYAKKLAGMVNGKTIIGGAHATLLPKDCLGYFDYLVMGEGEEAICDILWNKPHYSILVGNRIPVLDRIPYPDWDAIENPFSETLFPGEKYDKGEKAATLIASRGCPFNCAFCANIYYIPVIFRGVDNIIGEIKELKIRGIRYFRFEDDNVTIHPNFSELMSQLAELEIIWKCHARSDLLTQAKAKLMKEAGCEECGIGIESADNIVLKLNNKQESVEDHSQALTILHNAGIRAKAYWVMGLPGETDETVRLNKEFTEQYKPDKWTVSTFTPYPGCAIYKHPNDFGIRIIDEDFNHWWNFNEETNRYNHIILGQTMSQMWNRYKEFYGWLKEGTWQNA